VESSFTLNEGQCVTFVLRIPPEELPAVIIGQDDKNNDRISGEASPQSGHQKRNIDDPLLTKELLKSLLHVLGCLSFFRSFLIFLACTEHNSVLV